MTTARATLPLFLQLAADPLRWRLLTELAHSDLRVHELVARAGQPQNLVSYHLRLLREGGLISVNRSTHDGRESYYHLDLDRCDHELAVARGALQPALDRVLRSSSPRDPAPASTMSVLFICTGNSARSPMAAAMLRSRVGSRWAVTSAGSHPKAAFHPAAIKALQDGYGLRIVGARPRSWGSLTDEQFDVVISLCDKAREEWTRFSGRPPWAHWSVPDPAAVVGRTAEGTFQRVAEDIDSRVGHLMAAMASHQPRGTMT